MHNDRDLTGKVALVTGGSRGIGRQVALALARQGADIALNYHKSENEANKVLSEVEDCGSRCITICTDVSKSSDVTNMINIIRNKLGMVHILVNNAGIALQKKLIDTSLEEWNSIIATDLTGVFLCTKAVLPSMLSRKEGRIINIGSVLGQIGGLEFAAYSAAKGGIIAFTKAIARELVQDGIVLLLLFCLRLLYLFSFFVYKSKLKRFGFLDGGKEAFDDDSYNDQISKSSFCQ